MGAGLLEAIGGEAGCKRLSAAFYARVQKDALLRPLFPGKSLRCAIEEFAAFLVQFLGGAEEHTQSRWWLSLRESHARFCISPAQRSAWLRHMQATLEAAPLSSETREALSQFFLHGSAYVMGGGSGEPGHPELARRWSEQLELDGVTGAIADGRDAEVLEQAPRFRTRPSVFVGLLARMMQSGRPALIRFAADAVEQEPSLAAHRFNGRSLLHFAGGAGCAQVVRLLLRRGADPNIEDRGGHTPLYRVANECASADGAEIVRLLVAAGADVHACAGVTRATALHMAARRGHLEVARALVECGAFPGTTDRKGDTALQRAVNCRKQDVARFLRERMGG